MRKGGERGHREGTSRKKKPEVSRKLASIKADPKNNNNHVKMWTTLCPLDFATSHLVILEKTVSKIWWSRNNEVVTFLRHNV